MTKGPPLLRFGMAEPCTAALRRVRNALAREGLRIPAELDVSARIRQDFGAAVAPCTVLYVDDPALLLEAVVFHRGAALLIPEPLVVTGDNRHSEVLVRSLASLADHAPESVRDAVFELHKRIGRALETIAERQAAPLSASA
jgi:uncharacterized protein (DUF302 family)